MTRCDYIKRSGPAPTYAPVECGRRAVRKFVHRKTEVATFRCAVHFHSVNRGVYACFKIDADGRSIPASSEDSGA